MQADELNKGVAIVKVKAKGYQPAAVTGKSEEGRKLFAQLNCMACHSLHNSGGDLGPMLDGIGGHRSEEFILAHLSKAPDQIEKFARLSGRRESKLYHHVRFSPHTAECLTAYLLTLPEPAGGFIIIPHSVRLPATAAEINPKFKPAPRSSSSAEGEKLYNNFGCVACHSINNIGGWFGPSLDGVGGRRSHAFITAHITSAQAIAGKAESKNRRMPKFNATPEEVRKIADFLLTLPNPK